MFKKMLSYPKIIIVTLVCVVFLSSISLALTADLPKGELPIMITSSGQSPDAFVVKVLLDRAKISSVSDVLVEPDEIKDIKTLIIVMGGSTKGLGAAGIDEKMELSRTIKLMDEAEKLGIMMLGVHVGGEGRRGALSMQFIDVVAPRMQGLIVTEEGNQDGYFTKLSEEKEIPLTIVKTTPEVGIALQEIFQE